ncbi:hypothetical protein [Cupriavidus lacunae]|uniref:hypothetical protein n=1 Tax=Cupriavidus lacunae TaxID=2666307 RepID=UPI001374A9A9|nr:hypothetical protein [Cupriavidus lacunae]
MYPVAVGGAKNVLRSGAGAGHRGHDKAVRCKVAADADGGGSGEAALKAAGKDNTMNQF